MQADSNVTSWFVVTRKSGYKEPRECRFGQIARRKSFLINMKFRSIFFY